MGTSILLDNSLKHANMFVRQGDMLRSRDLNLETQEFRFCTYNFKNKYIFKKIYFKQKSLMDFLNLFYCKRKKKISKTGDLGLN